ncbi:unnamed protein product [Vitrella brassicaformis CCMP3155]|uniref:Uncharacterized protein n=2 Tax=Vitrella brassicaformis TaxID=1169539 RepID=A0A0G4FN83_VITBC|nr:unnamed protein product [Vitrella brassicaformis CCMP3155]|mmetsp:Transcript_33042/g.95367  ORF Transcript_33042/g.95367 Transcript_33042/m.95367 type:complete len:211 (-) Transcript_33042:618-1250(-)|eukprot:CEM15704.1 unnamed protein product [Vitrella brassicaformis CCMP3155]
MATRGVGGFRWKGRTVTVYNHWDSYPDGLGVALVQQLASAMKDDPQLTRWKGQIENLQEVDDEELYKSQTEKVTGGGPLSLEKVLSMGKYCDEGPVSAYDDKEYGYWIDLDRGRIAFAEHAKWTKKPEECDNKGTYYDGYCYSHFSLHTIPLGDDTTKEDVQRLFEPSNLTPMSREDILELTGGDEESFERVWVSIRERLGLGLGGEAAA